MSFQGRSSNASSFHASLFKAIDGVMFLALCQQTESQAPQHFKTSQTKAPCDGCFAFQSSVRSFPFTPAGPGQCIYRSFRRWMWNIDTSQSELPIPHFTICSKLSESARMIWHVWSDCHLLRQSSGGHSYVTASNSIVKLEVETV